MSCLSYLVNEVHKSDGVSSGSGRKVGREEGFERANESTAN